MAAKSEFEIVQDAILAHLQRRCTGIVRCTRKDHHFQSEYRIALHGRPTYWQRVFEDHDASGFRYEWERTSGRTWRATRLEVAYADPKLFDKILTFFNSVVSDLCITWGDNEDAAQRHPRCH
jgi:hypothetical protein